MEMANQPKTKPAASTKPMATNPGKAVAFVNPTAISADVGQKAVEQIVAQSLLDKQIEDQTAENEVAKGETVKQLTMAFAKAATIDKNIHLGWVNTGTKADIEKLYDQLRVAIGIKVVDVKEDGAQDVRYADWTREHFRWPGDHKDDPLFKKREEFRSNFMAQFKKAVHAADTIVSLDVKANDPGQGKPLLVSGKAVKERFQQDEVVLDGRREIKGADNKVTKLAKIPSFKELGQISIDKSKKQTGAQVPPTVSAPGATPKEADMIEGVDALTGAVDRLKGFGDALASALERLQSAIEAAIARNQGTKAA